MVAEESEIEEMMKKIENIIGYRPRYYTLASPDGEVVDDLGEGLLILRSELGDSIRYAEYIVYYDSIYQESWEGLRSYEDALRVARWIAEETGVGDVERIEKKLKQVAGVRQ